jgi:hypothetical protein
MKGFKFWMSLVMLALVATACSKKKDGGAAAPAKDSSSYYYNNNVCYDRDTDKQVSDSYCDNNSGYQNACVGYVYYINLAQGYMDRFDCRNPNSVDVNCQAPEKYVQDDEFYECYETDDYYGNSYNNNPY